jgi:hypothetical protein
MKALGRRERCYRGFSVVDVEPVDPLEHGELDVVDF